ncbi:MAG: Uncharacterized conserved protein UCP033563 [Atribacteria bacterium 34_128]|nr:MAG: Uncharacterized conserved protein UCP033563 [Atribacteria bacterium 34_128]
MPVIKPFKALRPEPELVTKVASPPYDVLNTEEARQLVKDNPYSFLHINKAEIDLDSSVDHYDQKVYEKARENLNRMIEEKVYLQDEQEKIYIYRQIMKGRAQTGLVVCASIDDYLKGKIKKHENTRADKEKDRINHIDFTDANTGPVFLTYKAKEEINQVVSRWTKEKEPVYDFTSEDEIIHTCWVIDDKSTIQQLVESFAKIDYLYIADGHHRAAAATKVGLKRREGLKNYTGKEEFNYFLSVLFPHDELYIMDYNRVVADLAGNSEEEFIRKISEKFAIEEYSGEDPYRPEARHTFGMYLNNRWYKLTARPGTFDEDDVVDSLDVSILQNNLLTPVLGIKDPRTDQRIEFVGGIRGLDELEKRVKAGMKIAFSLYPTSIEELMKVADAEKLMPPKSTWFEPKLRSGIFIHELS